MHNLSGKPFILILLVCITLGLSALLLLFQGSHEKTTQLFPQAKKEIRQDLKKSTPSIKEVTPKPQEVEIPIITYHYVEYVHDVNDTTRKKLSVGPAQFEMELKDLQKQGFTPIFAKDVPKIVAGIDTLAQKPIVLTFDDGYADFYTNVFPLLKKHKVKATAYIVPGFIGKNRNYMTMTELEEVAKSPYVEIGSHSMDHADLTSVSPERMKSEVVESKSWLEGKLRVQVDSFAYPYGFWNSKVEENVKDAEYTNAVTEIFGMTQKPDNLYHLSRERSGYFYTIVQH